MILINNVVDETLQNRSRLICAEKVVPGLVDWFIQDTQQCIQKSKICFRLLFYLIIKYIQMLRDEGQYDDTFTCSCVSQIVWVVNCIISVATSVYLLHLNQECSMINVQSNYSLRNNTSSSDTVALFSSLVKQSLVIDCILSLRWVVGGYVFSTVTLYIIWCGVSVDNKYCSPNSSGIEPPMQEHICCIFLLYSHGWVAPVPEILDCHNLYKDSICS